jgi:hypothetical protein
MPLACSSSPSSMPMICKFGLFMVFHWSCKSYLYLFRGFFFVIFIFICMF